MFKFWKKRKVVDKKSKCNDVNVEEFNEDKLVKIPSKADIIKHELERYNNDANVRVNYILKEYLDAIHHGENEYIFKVFKVDNLITVIPLEEILEKYCNEQTRKTVETLQLEGFRVFTRVIVFKNENSTVEFIVSVK